MQAPKCLYILIILSTLYSYSIQPNNYLYTQIGLQFRQDQLCNQFQKHRAFYRVLKYSTTPEVNNKSVALLLPLVDPKGTIKHSIRLWDFGKFCYNLHNMLQSGLFSDAGSSERMYQCPKANHHSCGCF